MAVTPDEDADDAAKGDVEKDAAEAEAAETEDVEAEDVEAEDVEAPGGESTDPVGTGRPWKRYARVGLVTAIYLGAFGVAGFLGWKLWEQHTVDKAGQNAQQTAVNYAQVLTSIDSDNLDQNFAEVLNGATGEFKDLYTKDSMRLRQLLVDNKATAHGVVVDSAIQSKSEDKVTVLLLVDQTVTNTARPDARSDSSRMKITMEKVDNRWLASTVELP
ncbi:hypothetical protein NGTWS1803_09690 [Mycolicibacterium cyprinidarum]|nr:hypothetical protein NGTWS1803_09690 [Mycolicibacterium sp. NGTWS1803]